MDEPLSFESEDLRIPSSLLTKTKRKKVIGLDDLLTDYYKEKSKIVEKESKRAKVKKNYSSDEDDDRKEAELSRCVEKCQKEMGRIGTEDEKAVWGLKVFGDQKVVPDLVLPKLGDLMPFQSFMKNKANTLIELDLEKGEVFLEELLMNGWLFKSVATCGHVEKTLAKWTFDLMMYSSNQVLATSACEFWCDILSHTNNVDKQPINIEWIPKISDIKKALETYGFLMHATYRSSSNMELGNEDSDNLGPPQNIRALIKFIAACCQVRNKYSIFSISEVEELLCVISCLFLDRKLVGLSLIMNKCRGSVTSFFTDKEWNISCKKIANSLSSRVHCDINCLRLVESIVGVDTRCKQLRREVAFQIIITCFEDKVTGAEEILKNLITINLKDKKCDLHRMYIYVILTDNWLSSNPILVEKSVIKEMWGVFLRNCSCHISSTDLRPYAAKVRSKASYLVQGFGK
jgi:hypothetical protein